MIRDLSTAPFPATLNDASRQQSNSFLLIDDDEELCALMRDFFHEQGYHLESVHDGRTGLSRALEARHSVVLLDWMLPLLDGLEVLRQIRRRSSIPVILLTARSGQQDRVAGLNSGADDYLAKPFGPEELLARIRAVLRRTSREFAARSTYAFGPLKVDPTQRVCTLDDKPVELTGIEFEILDYLVRSAERIVSRDELSTLLYQRPATPFERSIDVHISHLRKKLEGTKEIRIRSVRGAGYHLSLSTSA
jgi:two-component system, OmpR family, response regulator CpxR